MTSCVHHMTTEQTLFIRVSHSHDLCGGSNAFSLLTPVLPHASRSHIPIPSLSHSHSTFSRSHSNTLQMAPQIFLFILSSYLSKLLYLIGLKAPKEKISSNFFLFFNTSSPHMHSPLSGMWSGCVRCSVVGDWHAMANIFRSWMSENWPSQFIHIFGPLNRSCSPLYTLHSQ